jgi:predicted ribosome quality control (RQC) complex YloA/Tae2 family protein
MNKKNISSLELLALVNEMQFLINGKVSQIYQPEEKELILQLHAPSRGKVFLRIVAGKFTCISREKKTSETAPPGFCLQLRRFLDQAFIRKIEQKEAERIVIIELEKERRYKFISELFSKGNVILTDEKEEIIAVMEWQKFKDRTIKPKEKYKFPASGFNWKKAGAKEILGVLEKSEKKNLAVALATEMGLGGIYAEEACQRSGLNKDLNPKEINAKEAVILAESIKEMIKLCEKPAGFTYAEEITPFLLFEKEPLSKKDSYNEAIDLLNPYNKQSPYQQKIKSWERIISQQEESVIALERDIEINKLKGEKIYENYTDFQKLKEIVAEMRKKMSWEEIAKELKKGKKIKEVNLREKKVKAEFL